MTEIRPEGGAALRILRFPLVLLVLGFIAFLVLYVATGLISRLLQIERNTPQQLLAVIAMTLVGLGAYKLFQRYVEGRRDVEFAAPKAGLELAAGLGGGAAIFSLVVLFTCALGGMTIDGLRGGPGQIWSMLAMAVASGFYEELIFRGIVFRHLETMLGTWAALLLTSAFFGLAHIMNPNASWFAAFAIAVEAGIMLGAAYMLTRRLWLAVGIHAAWNFTQGWIFSVPVSGGRAPEGLLLTSRHGPDWLTGGAFGLEASAVALVGATLAGGLLLSTALRWSPAVPPMWVRR